MIENFLDPMPAIIERLRKEVPAFEQVLDAADIVRVKELPARTPHAQVLFDGYVASASESGRVGQGKGQRVVQRWLIVIGVKNAADQVRKKDSLLAAGALFVQVFRALAGWTPLPSCQALKLTSPRYLPEYTPTHAYFPIAFEGGLILSTE